MTKFAARFAAREVINAWKGLSGDALDKYMEEKFEKIWHVFNINKDDLLDVRNAYHWIRHLAGEEFN